MPGYNVFNILGARNSMSSVQDLIKHEKVYLRTYGTKYLPH